MQSELEKLVDDRVRKAMPVREENPYGKICTAFMVILLVGSWMLFTIRMDGRVRRLDGRLTELSDFAHGSAGLNARPLNDATAEPVPIQPRLLPRPATEPLPEPKEGQP